MHHSAIATGVVGRELSQSVANNELPLWLWFAWIPQLLTSLSRPEAAVVKPILKHLAHMYPQSLYCALRTFLLTLREGATRSVMEYERSKKVCEAALAAARAQAGEECEWKGCYNVCGSCGLCGSSGCRCGRQHASGMARAV